MASQAIQTTDRTPAKVAVASGGKLAAFIPATLEEAWRLSGALAASGMTPKAYGQDQNKIMVGIMAGAEVGLTPFAALQSIAVINGTPAMWGDGMLGLVEGSGLLEDMEEWTEGTTAHCRVVRKGRETPIVRTFSDDDAKAAGLLNKQGPWVQYRSRMRQLRARSFALRDGFADVLKGVKTAEEVQDYAPMGAIPLAASQPLTAAALLGHDEPANDGTLSDNAAAHEGRTDDQHGDQFPEDGQ